MIIVIDGYNLLHAIPAYKKTITDQDRRRFITQLNIYARAKGHKIILVFDGDSYDRPMKEKVGLVWIVYSGSDESADDYIKKYIHKNYAKELLLISTDRDLNRYALSYKVLSMDSDAFYQVLLENKQQQKNGAEKHHNIVRMALNSPQDIDTLMINASKVVPEKLEDIIDKKSRTSQSQQMNKQEKALLKKLRKL